MNKFKILITLVILLFTNLLLAQENLTLEQAVEIALKNNYSINIAKQQTSIADVNNTIGNAGFLPTVNLNASGNKSNTNVNQQFATGLSVDRAGVQGSGLNAAAVLNWTIFDGFKMFATKEKLKQLEEQSNINLKVAIENTIAQIAIAYYDVVQQQQLIKAIQEAIKVSDERIKLAKMRMNIGSGSKVDLLQAQADMNAQKAAVFKQQTALDNAKVTLNQLLARSTEQEFSVNDSIVNTYNPAYEDLKKTIISNNNQLQFAKKNIAIAEQSLKEIRAARLPIVGLNAAYNFTQSNSQAGLLLTNKNIGPVIGFTASLPLFNGLRTQTQIKSAYYQLQINELMYKQTSTLIEASLLRAWKSYNNAKQVLALEEENIGIIRENIAIALERFKIGSSTTLELITAQNTFQEGLGRLVSARYDAKLAEIELMRLNGALVK